MGNISAPVLNSQLICSEPGKKHHFDLCQDLYDRYACAFYGEIRRHLFNEELANQTLADAYMQIWNGISNFDSSKGSLFAFCFRVVRKEIQRRKVDLLLKEVFACQQLPAKSTLAADKQKPSL